MPANAITVDTLGKEYRILPGQQRAQYSTLRDTIAEQVGGLLKRGPSLRATRTSVWAIRDVSFAAQEGEVLGIIGKNGSGKSTLLKVLSDIVEPTEGRAEIRGRVASLLEVGTGFHAELTGRENVYLNGAILGMSRQEITRNFDRIVDFSGIGQYIDTPVKRYSSGMYMRLAFSVAAHLEPQVLIVDEVLAVGDYEFQQRCIGRMKEVGQSGRTVLFVSHNMAAIEALCTRCLLLSNGRQELEGEPYEVVRAYRKALSTFSGDVVADLSAVERRGGHRPVMHRAYLADEEGTATSSIVVSKAFEARVMLRVDRPLENPVFIVRVDNAYGERALTLSSPIRESSCQRLGGDCEVVCRVRDFPLAPGQYKVGFAVMSRGKPVDAVDAVLGLSIANGECFGEGHPALAGTCVARAEWDVLPTSVPSRQTSSENSKLLATGTAPIHAE